MDPSALVLLPEHDVRVLLRERTLFWRLLRPPYPALGVGALRLLRLREDAAGTELVVGYERYERLDETRRSPANAAALLEMPSTESR